MNIVVTNNNLQLGTLSEHINGDIHFIYVKNLPTTEYIPSLENAENVSSSGLFSVFEALLPEDGKVEQIKAEHSLENSIEILLFLESIHGAFSFYSEDDYTRAVPTSSVVVSYPRDKKRLLGEDYTFPNILDYSVDIDKSKLFNASGRSHKVIGLSGVQDKLSVLLNQRHKVIQAANDSDYFMKPFNREYASYHPHNRDATYIPHLAINEHLFMSFAKGLGFDVPWSAIVKGDIEYHYIIKRFDRLDSGRIEHYDLGALMQVATADKYSPTYERVFIHMKELLEKEELKKAFKFLIMSIVIGHADLHVKNLSLIAKDNKTGKKKSYLFAPLYDVSTACIYKVMGKDDIGLKVGGKKSKISLNDLLDFGVRLEIDNTETKHLAFEVIDYFEKNFMEYIESLPTSILSLSVNTGGLYTKTLKEVYYKYYSKRMQYIHERLRKSVNESTDIF